MLQCKRLGRKCTLKLTHTTLTKFVRYFCCAFSEASRPTSMLAEALIAQFYEASEFLTHNIVQGTLTDQGNYGMQATDASQPSFC